VEAGEEFATRLLAERSGALPEALFCVNDLVALGVSAALSRRLRVPDDVAVLGYDDIEFARIGVVPLSSVHTPQEELGTTAAELLLEEIELGTGPDDSLTRPHIELAPQVIVRASTAT
jgi:LacI family transcriptional regulator